MREYQKYLDAVHEAKKNFVLVQTEKEDNPPRCLDRRKLSSNYKKLNEELEIQEERISKIRPNMSGFRSLIESSSETYSKRSQYGSNGWGGSSLRGTNNGGSNSNNNNNSAGVDDAQPLTEETYMSVLRYKNIFAPDRFLKHGKVDLYILPMIYQFILRETSKEVRKIVNYLPTCFNLWLLGVPCRRISGISSAKPPLLTVTQREDCSEKVQSEEGIIQID